ncbi:hypothetical protein [Microbacterium sediminis]|nr:hypothetical protein [Microbacterium sediminis]
MAASTRMLPGYARRLGGDSGAALDTLPAWPSGSVALEGYTDAIVDAIWG